MRKHLADVLVSVVVVLARLTPSIRAVKGLVVLGLASYGSWLIYHPAGYLVAAGLLLLDLATDAPTRRRTWKDTT